MIRRTIHGCVENSRGGGERGGDRYNEILKAVRLRLNKIYAEKRTVPVNRGSIKGHTGSRKGP